MPIANLEKIKELVGIDYTDTTHDLQLAAMILPTQDWLLEYLNNDFHLEPYYLASTISFDGLEISDSAGELDVDGFSDTMDFHVQGSLVNGGVYFAESADADTITINSEYCDELETETAGELIRITRVKFPRGLKIPFAKLINFDLNKKCPGATSFSLADYSVEYAGEGNYPPDLLKSFSPWRQMKFKRSQ